MKPIKFFISLVTILVIFIPIKLAYAHSDEYLNTQIAPNGGQLRMAGVYHFELVLAKVNKEIKDNPVIVYVTDHAGAKISTAGASGSATILSGKNKSIITLNPDGDNRLKGNGKYSSTSDVKVVLSIKMLGKDPEQAKFTPFVELK